MEIQPDDPLFFRNLLTPFYCIFQYICQHSAQINALVNSILSEFAERASRYKAIVEYSIVIGRSLNMEDIDLCRMLTNILLERFIMLENCAMQAIRINKAGREQRIFQIRDSRSALIIVRIRSISMRNGFARTRLMISVRASAKGGYIK